MVDIPNDPSSKPTTFSALLNYLFATRLKADGKEYSLGEVSRATGLKVPYLSNLRTGKIGMPPADRAQVLADFFGVNVGYFTGKFQGLPPSGAAPLEEPQDRELWDALRKPLVREVALRAGAMGSSERAIILEMLDRAEHLAKVAEAADPTRLHDDKPDDSTSA